MARSFRSFSARLLAGAAAVPALVCAAQAQPGTDEAEGEPVEVIEVGGRAPGASVLDRPVSVVTGADIAANGFTGLGDAMPFLPSVAGSEFNDDPGTQNDTSGTASVNLRGLGLGSTLVLMNGQRQTQASVAADDGARFVDMNALVPAIAVNRVEVLKDGASPIYGSDAVAGVINVVTRDGYEGFEARAEHRDLTGYAQGSAQQVSAIGGRDFGAVHLTAAAEWLDRDGLEGFETDFVPGTGISTLGQPGSYYILDPEGGFEVTTEAGGPASIIDSDCAAGGGMPLVSGPETEFGTVGSCGLDYGQFFSVQTDEQKLSAFAALTADFGDTRFALRASGADQSLTRGNSPSLANLRFPVIPQSHPANPYGRDVVWLGRPQGVDAGAARRGFDHETYRIEAEAAHDFALAGRAWTLTGDFTYSRNELTATITDTLADNFDAALAGFGGADCPGAGQWVQAGDTAQGCYYFNPFGTGGLVMDPSDPRYNDPAVYDFIIRENERNSKADLAVFEAVASTDFLVSLPAGDVSAAFGVQTRRESYEVTNGEAFNEDGFLFIVGGPDYAGARTAKAAFADAIVPLTERLQAQIAVRHEDQGGFSSTDPKIGARFDATGALTFRASWSQSYRAPSLHQQVSASTTLQSLNVAGSSSFLPVRTVGNDELDPETADTLSAGAVFAGPGFTLSADYWRVDYEDLIVRESAQAILNADAADGVFDDPRVVVNQNGDVVRVRSAFVNAPRVEADGVDLALDAAPVDLGRWGEVSAGAEAAIITTFTLVDPVLGEEIDAAGNRNFTNFARSVPEFRAAAHLDWALGRWNARAGLRHVGAYDDDENGGDEIGSWTALDVQAGWTAPVAGREVSLTVGAQNLTDEAAPFVQTPLGYDTKVHDPRGRIAYVRAGVRF